MLHENSVLFCNPKKEMLLKKYKIIYLKAEKKKKIKAEKIEDQGQGSGWNSGSHPGAGNGRIRGGQVPAGVLGDFDRDVWGTGG